MAETATREKPKVEAQDTATAASANATSTVDASTEAVAAPVSGRGLNRPTYGLGAPLDELPAAEPAGRALIYDDLLGGIISNEGLHNKWVPVAEFKTRAGAKTAQNEIGKGNRSIPKAKPGHSWSFGSRILKANDDPTKRYSVLYARYNTVAVTE